MISLGKRPYILHPFLFALFPVFFLFALNVGQMYFIDVIIPAAISIVGVAIVMLIFFLIIKDISLAGLIASIITLFFFSYGHLARLVSAYISHWLSLTVLILILVIIIAIIVRKKPKLIQTTRILNIIAAALLLIQVPQIFMALISEPSSTEETSDNSPVANHKENLPDVYFIVLDGYGRQDVLSEMYKYDNSDFIEFLRSNDFTVADSSHSNYGQTLLSLAGTLNMDYVQNIHECDSLAGDRLPLYEKLRHNKVMNLFKKAGYTISSFSSGYSLSEIRKVDNYISASWMPGEYGNMLLSFTPLPVIFSRLYSPFEIHHKRVMHILENLADRKKADTPQFIFAHIICPHPPFVFSPDGESIPPDREFNMEDGSHFLNEGGTVEEYKTGYINQVKYINAQMTKVIEHLLTVDPDNRPIIIIQADHGPGSELSWVGSSETNLKERFSILNAILLPKSESNAPYVTISPVNTFRLIANILFDSGYEPLPDKSYFSTWEDPFDLMPVNDNNGLVYDYLLQYYLSLKPGKIEYLHISHPLPPGSGRDAEQCLRLTPKGILIDLERKYHATLMELCVEDDDDYLVQYLNGDTVVAELTLFHLESHSDILRDDTLIVPYDAAMTGYDNIIIMPQNGDGIYTLGYIRLGNPAKR
ncbi:MAG: sulfatase-like hydrolase/transferase [Candidatus Zixiibacteriota bacterium]